MADVNEHFLHSDGDMHSYSIDKEHTSCLNADEDYKSHLDSVQVQRSMSDDPILKQTIRYGSNNLLIRERLISAQKEELTFSIEQAAKVHIYYFMKG